MVGKLIAASTAAVAALTISSAYTQRSALVLRQEQQDNYWPRYGTVASGRYSSGVWVASPDRQSYGTFRGGGPGVGK
jgi:hypothetical protein